MTKNRGRMILKGTAAAVLIGSVAVFAVLKIQDYREQKQYEVLRNTAVTEEASRSDGNSSASKDGEVASEKSGEEPLQNEALQTLVQAQPKNTYWYEDYANIPDKNIDFAELTQINPDIYAWITIPGTEIDYPIAHCDSETAVYLDHDMYGDKSSAGMIFTDTYNSNDFSDPMTLVYGHNMKNGTMFAGLHAFRDSQFFQEHDLIKIYMNGAELDYRIFACYIAKNEHILRNYDFGDALVFDSYFENARNLRDLSANFRKDISFDYKDHVINLVTCIGQDDKRLFVQAVLQEPINE